MLGNLQRRGIDTTELVAAELAKEQTFGGRNHSVRLGVPGRHASHVDVTGFGVEAAHLVRFLFREPDDAPAIDHRSMWISANLELPHVPGFRIELADVTLVVGGEPDVAVAIHRETVRT